MKTERATLRPWRTAEIDRLYDIRRRPEIAAWLGSPEPWTYARTRGFVLRHEHVEVAELTEPMVALAIVPDATGVPVGTVSASPFPDSDENEIGWYLHPDSMGQGWATEAAAAIHAWVVSLGRTRVWAGMWPHNNASAAVCRRIGMTDLGIQDDPWYGTVEYPLGRMFCSWTDDSEHPLEVLRRCNATARREHATAPPPVGADGATYPLAL